MSLIDAERDDEAVLRAEDEAIRAAEAGEKPEAAIPVGDDLAALIEELSNATGLQPGREG